jgi:hypothetical protein
VTDQTPEPTGPRERDPGQARRRPWWGSPGAVVAAVAVVVAVGLAVPVARELLHDEPASPVRGAPWEQLPRPPANEVLGGPEAGPAVWTGTELILLARSTFGAGSAQLPDGLAYAPATRRWRVLPDPPPDLPLRGGPVGAVWTGREVIVVRSAGPPIAYDPDADAWRPLAPLPHGVVSNLDPAPVWTGAEVLVWNAGSRDQAANKPVDGGTGAAYDPRGNRWRRLARAPVPGRGLPLTAWTGDRAIFVGGVNVGVQPREDRGNIAAIIEQGVAYWPAGG